MGKREGVLRKKKWKVCLKNTEFIYLFAPRSTKEFTRAKSCMFMGVDV